MTFPLIERSIRWRLLIPTAGFMVVFCLLITLHHNRIHDQAVQDALGRMVDVSMNVGSHEDQVMAELGVARRGLAEAHRSMHRSQTVIALVLLAAGVAVLSVVTRRVTAPVSRLAASVQAFAGGDYTATLGLQTSAQDEVGRLSRDFAQMVQTLHENNRRLEQTAEEARRNGIFLDAIIENLPQMIFVKDAKDLKFVLINKACEIITGHRRDDAIGKSDYDHYPVEQADAFTAADRRALQNDEWIDIMEEPLTGADGRVRFLHTRKRAILDRDGNPQYLLGISEDITEAKRIALEKQLFFEQSMDLLGIADLDTNIIEVNNGFLETLGYSRDEVIGKSYLDLIHPEEMGSALDAVDKLKEGVSLLELDRRFRRRDGEYRQIVWNVATRPGLNFVYAVGRDVTDQRRIEELVVQGVLQEQERIARDLHDGLGQVLTGLAFKGKLIEQMLLDGERPEPGMAADMVRLANEASEQARLLARGLDPVVLEEGLVPALHDLAHATLETFGTPCRFEHGENGFDLGKDQARQLYWIAQEAVNNAVKHGKSQHISIYLTRRANAIELVVMDDGTGLKEEAGPNAGQGLRIMRHRARMMGGDLSIMPGPAGGLLVKCLVEIKAPANGAPRALVS